MIDQNGPEPAGSTCHTFILRCWVGEGRRVRGRLIDVSTGLSRPLREMDGLPASLEELMLEPPPHKETPE